MVQHKAIRFITGLRGIFSVTDAREKLGLQTLETRRRDSRLRLMLNILVNEKLHDPLSQFFNSHFSSVSGVVTRSSALSIPTAPSTNTTFFNNSFMVRTMRDMRSPMRVANI